MNKTETDKMCECAVSLFRKTYQPYLLENAGRGGQEHYLYFGNVACELTGIAEMIYRKVDMALGDTSPESASLDARAAFSEWLRYMVAKLQPDAVVYYGSISMPKEFDTFSARVKEGSIRRVSELPPTEQVRGAMCDIQTKTGLGDQMIIDRLESTSSGTVYIEHQHLTGDDLKSISGHSRRIYSAGPQEGHPLSGILPRTTQRDIEMQIKRKVKAATKKH